MKLFAIYNVWVDSIELLRGSMKRIKNHVDGIIIVYQDVSNYGEKADTLSALLPEINGIEVTLFKYLPILEKRGFWNETRKRNIGLDVARKLGGTHFLHMDSDEYYFDFAEAKDLYIKAGHDGSVVSLYTYFKLPTLRFEKPEGYFVPFIHKLNQDTISGVPEYPFYCDPTRRINCTDVIELPIKMHHFSWVRKDIQMKIRNSSAKGNIENSQLLSDWDKAGTGSFIKDYNTSLIEVPNLFGISI